MEMKSNLPDWSNETAVVLACGPSLCKFDVDYIKHKARVIAINNSYVLAPWAEILYACDARWWRHHNYVSCFKGDRWTQENNGSTWRGEAEGNGINVISSKNGVGLSVEPSLIHLGMNSGFQAINMAYLCGARRIILLGFDCGVWDRNKTHFFGKHPDSLERPSPYHLFRKTLSKIAIDLDDNGVDVVNCSRMSTLTCFKTGKITEILE